MTPKSPFYVINDFVSPLFCEEIVDDIGFTVPDTDVEGHSVKTVIDNERFQFAIVERLQPHIPTLEQYYGFKYVGTEQPVAFEWFPEGYQGEFICENSNFLRGKWLRTRSRDLSAVLFLSDYQDKIPFDNEFEVYGGKLEFPQWAFGFNPRRGTLIVYPSVPNFINLTSRVLAGDLYQVRCHLAATSPYIYMPDRFPGNYTTWFKNEM